MSSWRESEDVETAFSQLSQTSQASQTGTLVDDYILAYTIGVGEFSKVKLAKHIETGESVAVKVIPLEALQAHPVLSREIYIHTQLDHPRIVPVLRFIERPDAVYLVMPLASRGELFDAIVPDQGLPLSTCAAVVAQLLDALAYLHAKGIAHRDIKPENILIGDDGSVLLTDFGFATEFTSPDPDDPEGTTRIPRWLSTPCGSAPYVAPEVLSRKYRGPPADVWSLGIVLFVMLTGTIPWDAPTHAYFEFTAVVGGNMAFGAWASLPSSAADLLARIFVLDPEARISVQELQAHPFLAPSTPPKSKPHHQSPIPVSPTARLFADMAVQSSPISSGAKSPQSQSPPASPTSFASRKRRRPSPTPSTQESESMTAAAPSTTSASVGKKHRALDGSAIVKSPSKSVGVEKAPKPTRSLSHTTTTFSQPVQPGAPMRLDSTTTFSTQGYSQPTRTDDTMFSTQSSAQSQLLPSSITTRGGGSEELATFEALIPRMTRVASVSDSDPRTFLEAICKIMQANRVDVRPVPGRYKAYGVYQTPNQGTISFTVRLLKTVTPGVYVADFMRGRGLGIPFKRLFALIRDHLLSSDLISQA